MDQELLAYALRLGISLVPPWEREVPAPNEPNPEEELNDQELEALGPRQDALEAADPPANA